MMRANAKCKNETARVPRPAMGGGGGGVGSPPRRFPPAPPTAARFRLAAVGAAAVALTAALAAQPVAWAQTCSPTGYTGELPTVAYDGTTEAISCDTLTGGLEMTLGPDLQLGTAASPLTERGVVVDADGDGNEDIVVMGSGTIYANQSGIWLQRDGTGLLKLEFAKGKIVAGGSTEGFGISLRHTGEENEESKGIHIVSGGDIDLSAHTSDSKQGIKATTANAASNATIPIVIRVTGGTVDVSDPAGSTPGLGGSAIKADQYAKGDVAITVEKPARLGTKEAVAGAYGIEAWLWEDSEGDLTIVHRGGIHAGEGIFARSDATSVEKGNITITTEAGSTIVAKEVKEYDNIDEEGIEAAISNAANTGDIAITHNGAIDADGRGINASNSGKGDITVTTGAGSKIAAGKHGIEASGKGGVEIAHNGAVDAGHIAIFAIDSGTGDVTVTTGSGSRIVARGDVDDSSGINASARGSAAAGDVTVTHGGELTAKDEGIYVSNRRASAAGTGTLSVTTARGSKVTAGKQGILVWHQGTGPFDVAVRGTVMGDSAHTSGSDTDYAGVHIQVKEGETEGETRPGGGGKLVLGPRAHLSAKSGTAIKIDERAGAVTVILEKDQYGLAGQLEGKILNADSTATAFKARAGETGAARTLSEGDRVDMRGETHGVYDKVHRTRLMPITGGHEFKKLSETRLYHDRARVYEALPAVLLDLNGQLPYQERMAAPRDGDGLWARLAAGDGARRPARSTTARGFTGRALAWDVAQYGFEGGLDFRPAATERLLLGVSLHARQGEATVEHGGTIDVSGFGGGVSATYRDAAGVYLDGRFSYTYFDDVDLTSRTRGAVQSDLSGHGYALGLEAGKRLGWEGLAHVALTPRARVVWSTVKLEDFADLAGVAGSGRVALETATSLKGGLGLLAETAFGGATLEDWTGHGGRLFASLDVEHEFAVDREMRASGTALASEVRATWGRVGLGGALIWTEGLTLSGEGFYATAGSDNTDFGGSLTLTFRF